MRGIEALSDVPTIVPIILALVLFFSSIVWAINRVNSLNDDIQMSLDLIRVAETFTQTAYITHQSFQDFCDVTKTQFGSQPFVVAVLPMETYKQISRGDPKSFLVEIYNRAQMKCPKNISNLSSALSRASKVLVSAFPVLVQDITLPRNDLRVMVVGLWRAA